MVFMREAGRMSDTPFESGWISARHRKIFIEAGRFTIMVWDTSDQKILSLHSRNISHPMQCEWVLLTGDLEFVNPLVQVIQWEHAMRELPIQELLIVPREPRIVLGLVLQELLTPGDHLIPALQELLTTVG